MTLNNIMNLILGALAHAGAHHPSFGAVSDHFGQIITRHWHITIQWRK